MVRVDPEDQADLQQRDQEPQGDRVDPEVPVVRVDPEVQADQVVQGAQQRNLESLGNQEKLQLNPRDCLVAQEVRVDPEVLEAREVQAVLVDPGDQGDLVVLQLLRQGNLGDLEAPEDQEVPVDRVVQEVQKHLRPANQVVQEDRVGPEVLEAQADPEDREDPDVLCARRYPEQKQHRKLVQQNLELPRQQLESHVSRFHQVTWYLILLSIM